MNTELCGIEFTGTVIKEPRGDNEFIQNLGGQIIQKSGLTAVLDSSERTGVYARYYVASNNNQSQFDIPDYFTMMRCTFGAVTYSKLADAQKSAAAMPINASLPGSPLLFKELYMAFATDTCPLYYKFWQFGSLAGEMAYVNTAVDFASLNQIISVTSMDRGSAESRVPVPIKQLPAEFHWDGTSDSSLDRAAMWHTYAMGRGAYYIPSYITVPGALLLSALPGSIQYKQAKYLHDFLANCPPTIAGIKRYIFALQYIKICKLSSGALMEELKSDGSYDIPLLYLVHLFNLCKTVFFADVSLARMAVNALDIDSVNALLDTLVNQAGMKDIVSILDIKAQIFLCGSFVSNIKFTPEFDFWGGHKIAYHSLYNVVPLDENASGGMPICPPYDFDFRHPEKSYAGRWVDLGFTAREKNSITTIILYAAGMTEQGEIRVNSLLDAALQMTGSYANALSDVTTKFVFTPEDFDFHSNAGMMIDVEATRRDPNKKIVMKFIGSQVASVSHAPIDMPVFRDTAGIIIPPVTPPIPPGSVMSTQEVLQHYQPLYELKWSEGGAGHIPPAATEKEGGWFALIIGALAAGAAVYYSTKG